MEIQKKIEQKNRPTVGVFFDPKNTDYKKLFREFKNEYIFSNSLDQFSIFLCDILLVKNNETLKHWESYFCLVPIEKAHEIESRWLNFYEKKESDFLSIEKEFLSLFSSVPVDLYSGISHSTKMHHRKYKSRGLYSPATEYKDSLIKSIDSASFFRVCVDKLINCTGNKQWEYLIKFSFHLLAFLRKNQLIISNPIQLYGINLAIYKTLKNALENNETAVVDIFSLAKMEATPNNQIDLHTFLMIVFSIYSNQPNSYQLACLFLNTLFEKNELFFIDSNLDIDSNNSLTSKDKELVLNHAREIALVYEKLKIGDSLFLNAIKHHHGSSTGKGFFENFRSAISKDDLKLMALMHLVAGYIELRPVETFDHALTRIKKNISNSELKRVIDQIYFESKTIF